MTIYSEEDLRGESVEQATILHRSDAGDGIITVSAGDECARGEQVTIGIVEDDGQVRIANDLLNRMFAWRGYGSQHKLRSGPLHTIFTASIAGKVVGTITLAIDSPAGLPADEDFADDVDRIRRRPGAKICELTKLAFDANVSSKPMLAALFHVVFIYGQKKYGCTNLLIEVYMRHVRYYESMLGFKHASPPSRGTSTGFGVQLMALDVGKIRQMIDMHAAAEAQSRSGRSLYAFFLSRHQERQVSARLAARGAWYARPEAVAQHPTHETMSRLHPAPGMPEWLAVAGRDGSNPAGERRVN